MKIALGAQLQDGPWGGGNQFASSLSSYLRSRGHELRFSLDLPDLDIIVLTEPRRTSASSAFNDGQIWSYLRHVNPDAVVVHRINECDERKGTHWVNRRLVIANRCADHTVFISSWLRDLFHAYDDRLAPGSVILNGADQEAFHAEGGATWDGHEPLRVVTHHWSQNWNKGFEIYQRLDQLLGRPEFARRFAFTFIGRVPAGMVFRHVQVHPPLSGLALGAALRAHHVYLTASLNEPAGMHHIEGALSGLPLLYRSSGALPEYCDGFGVSFEMETFEARLLEMHERYATLRTRMGSYSHDAETMCRAYEKLFIDLRARPGWRRPRRGVDGVRAQMTGWWLDTRHAHWGRKAEHPPPASGVDAV
jgi:hypothetical protein